MAHQHPLDEANFNQSPSFENIDPLALDAPLTEVVTRAGLAREPLSAFARSIGSAEAMEEGRLANENPPRLRTVDAKGHRIDRVEFHPAYHALMRRSTEAGIHCSAFDGSDAPAPVVARAVRQYMMVGVEAGHMCPITMTNAAIPALRAAPDLLARLKPKLLSRSYDARSLPWWQKTGMTIGMGMTERQGGTDVRANITRAVADGPAARITGHKWFMSAPMCDAFLVLAQGEAGLSCYFLPRHAPDGQPNGLRFHRLKNKLGNVSNASSEVEFFGAYAEPVGAPGAGVKTIIEMVQWTRLDCAVSSAGLMRMALAHAVHHTRHRTVFQRHLADQPAMRAVLADMALEMEAQVALVFRLARAFDRAARDPDEAAYARLMTPAVKYLVCKRAPAFIYEAMECLGGNGYVEELPLARLYREAPLNAIWEGSGNVMALDLLRAVGRQPDATLDVLRHVTEAATAVAPRAKEIARSIMDDVRRGDAEARARTTIETLAKLATVSALVEAGSPFAHLYASTRLEGARVDHFGATAIDHADERVLLSRALAA